MHSSSTRIINDADPVRVHLIDPEALWFARTTSWEWELLEMSRARERDRERTPPNWEPVCMATHDGVPLFPPGTRNEEMVFRADGSFYFVPTYPEPRPPRVISGPVLQRPRVPQLRARPRSSRRSSRTVPAAATATAESPSGPSAPSHPPTCRRCHRYLTAGDPRQRLCAPCALLVHHREGGAS